MGAFANLRWLVALAALAVAGGCGLTESITRLSKPSQPDIGALYNRAAQFHDGLRNPVIVIPGVLGTRLVDSESGKTVWGEINRKTVDPEDPQGARIVAHAVQYGVPLHDLTDQVVQAKSLGRIRVKVAGIPIEQQAYGEILTSLGVGGYRDEDSTANGVDYGAEHFTCFQFSYDWRRDNAENAALLDQFIKEKAEYVRRERERRFGVTGQPVRFDIVAHSMGGLIARYYMRYGEQPLSPNHPLPELNWAGSNYVDRLILVGTPSGGSVQALQQVVDGRRLGPFLPTYQPAILGSMPSLYQLMPRVRHKAIVDQDTQHAIDIYDVEVWEKYGWGLLDPSQDKFLRYLLPDVQGADQRREVAREHLAKCLNQADNFHTLLDVPASPPAGTTIHLIAGDAEPTDAKISVAPGGKLTVAQQAPGDSTVTRRSALMDERNPDDPNWTSQLVTPVDWHSVNFFFSGHIELTSNVEFTDNLLYLLLEAPRKLRPSRITDATDDPVGQ